MWRRHSHTFIDGRHMWRCGDHLPTSEGEEGSSKNDGKTFIYNEQALNLTRYEKTHKGRRQISLLKLKSILNQCLNKFIPTKMTSPRENLPWLSKSLLASIRKKTSLYSKAKRTNKADLWAKYKLCKRQTQRAIRSARWSFLKNKLSESLEQKKSKPLWRYIKSKRQDGNGVSPLKENGQLHSDSRRKAEILNSQFCSVFTSEDITNMPKFEITVQGVTKLLEGLNGGKASGPDELPNLILKNAANEISPFLKNIFDQSLQTGKLPDDWVEANVAPVFKKGDRHSPANYRPISLTCICASF